MGFFRRTFPVPTLRRRRSIPFTAPAAGITVVIPVFQASDDGSFSYQDTVWPPSGGTGSAQDGTSVDVRKSLITATYTAQVGLFRFDTARIPSDATVTAANFRFYATLTGNPDGFSLLGSYYDFGGEPSDSSDWVETTSPQIFSVSVGSLTSPGSNSLALSSLTGINLSGYTGIRLTLSAGTPTAQNYVLIAAEEDTTNPPAELEITYTPGHAAGPTGWLRHRSLRLLHRR